MGSATDNNAEVVVNHYHALIESLEPCLTAVIPFLTVRDVARLSCVCRILHRWTCSDVVWKHVCQSHCRYAELLLYHLSDHCPSYYDLAKLLWRHQFNPVKIAPEIGVNCVEMLTNCLETMVAVARETALSDPSILDLSVPPTMLFHTEWLFRCCVSLRNDRHHVLPQGMLCRLLFDLAQDYCVSHASLTVIPLEKRSLRWLVSEWWIYEYILNRLTMLSQKIDDHQHQYNHPKSGGKAAVPPPHSLSHPHYASFLSVAQTCLRGSALPAAAMSFNFNRKLSDYSCEPSSSMKSHLHSSSNGPPSGVTTAAITGAMEGLLAGAAAASTLSGCGHTLCTGCGKSVRKDKLSKHRRKTLVKFQKTLASHCPSLNVVVNRDGGSGSRSSTADYCTCGGPSSSSLSSSSPFSGDGSLAAAMGTTLAAQVGSASSDGLSADLSCHCWLCTLGIDVSQFKDAKDMQNQLRNVPILVSSRKSNRSSNSNGKSSKVRMPKLNALPPYLSLFAKHFLCLDTREGVEHWQRIVKECVSNRAAMRLLYESCIVFDSVGFDVPKKLMPNAVFQRDFYRLSDSPVYLIFKDEKLRLSSAAASISPYLREFMGKDAHCAIDISWMEGEVKYLERVVQFLEHFVRDPMPHIPTPVRSHNLKKVTSPFYSKFAQDCDRKDCFVMILLGNALSISPLVHLFCARIATMIKSLRPEDVREIMAIESEHMAANGGIPPLFRPDITTDVA